MLRLLSRHNISPPFFLSNAPVISNEERNLEMRRLTTTSYQPEIVGAAKKSHSDFLGLVHCSSFFTAHSENLIAFFGKAVYGFFYQAEQIIRFNSHFFIHGIIGSTTLPLLSSYRLPGEYTRLGANVQRRPVFQVRRQFAAQSYRLCPTGI